MPMVSPGFKRGGRMGFLFKGSIITIGSGLREASCAFRVLCCKFQLPAASDQKPAARTFEL